MSARTSAAPATAPGRAPSKTSPPGRRLGLALVVIATAQLMVVLDATIVNVALPHIQRALGFSGANLEWVINAYALAFGGLLLLGGRAGDLLGRRKVFITGIIVFSAASLAGGFATTQAWLLAARAIQGAGAAITAPTALSLVTTTFPEGPPRNRALGVYAAMSVTGGVVGLIAGGLLTTYVSWRWVLFVNVPIGIAVALAAPRVLRETRGHRGRFDLPGAITGTGGLAALVYGLSNAATSPDGVSHWGDAKVVAALAAAVVLLATFAAVEIRSTHALLPLHLLRSRDRSGAVVSAAEEHSLGISGVEVFGHPGKVPIDEPEDAGIVTVVTAAVAGPGVGGPLSDRVLAVSNDPVNLSHTGASGSRRPNIWGKNPPRSRGPAEQDLAGLTEHSPRAAHARRGARRSRRSASSRSETKASIGSPGTPIMTTTNLLFASPRWFAAW